MAKLTIEVFNFVLLLKDVVPGPTLDAVQVEGAIASLAVPDGVRLFDAGNANQTGSGAGPAFEAVQQHLPRPDGDGGDVGVDGV